MTLFTKCILAPPSPEDGIRISVMSRHTLNDGETPDQRITRETYHQHWRTLAPPAYLVGSYYKRGLSWEAFEQGYKEYLSLMGDVVSRLALKATVDTEAYERLMHGERFVRSEQPPPDITLLCIEETAERCHRRLLAEACQTWSRVHSERLYNQQTLAQPFELEVIHH